MHEEEEQKRYSRQREDSIRNEEQVETAQIVEATSKR